MWSIGSQINVIWMINIQQGIKPPTLYEYAWTQQLNQQQRTTSTTWQLQHYNLINIHHLIATSYNHQHIYIPSCNNSLTKLFIQNKAIRTDNIILSFQVCTKASSKQKCMTTTQEHEKRYNTTRLLAVASKHCSLLHSYSPWRVGSEQTLLSVTPSSRWRAVYSRWRT